MKFKNTFDKTTKIITGIIILLFIGLSFPMFIESTPWYVNVLVLALFSGILYLSWALHPRSYSIQDGELIIHRFYRTIHIPLISVVRVEPVELKMLKNSFRILGSGGLFGYYGLFQNRTLGKYLCYVTNSNKMVMVKTGKDTYIISPEENEQFVEVMQEKLHLNAEEKV